MTGVQTCALPILQVVDSLRQVLGKASFFLDERLVDEQFGCSRRQLHRPPLLNLLLQRAEVALQPIPHITIVEKLIEAFSFRQIGVVRKENAVSSDGMKMFGVMDLSSGFDGCRFAVGLRNSHDKSFRLSCTVGLRVFVCENLSFHGRVVT